MVDCGRLWSVVADWVDCGRLWQIVAYCDLLWSIAVDCSRLRPMGEFTKSAKSAKSNKSTSTPFRQAPSSNTIVNANDNINVRLPVNRVVVK